MKPETNTGRSHVDTAWMGVAGGLYPAPMGRVRGRAPSRKGEAAGRRVGPHPLEAKNPRWPVRR